MSTSISVHVDTHGLQDRLSVLKDREIKTAIRRAVSKAGTRGRTLARGFAPVGAGTGDASHVPGAGRTAISKTSTRGGDTARCIIFIAGGRKGPAFYMYFQDQGTNRRSTRGGRGRKAHSTGSVEPQYFMERAATDLEGWLPLITEAEIAAAIKRSGL